MQLLDHTKARRPVGGYKVVVDGHAIVGGSVDSLLDQIGVFRAQAGIDLGDPESEVAAIWQGDPDRRYLVVERVPTADELEAHQHNRVAELTFRAWRNQVSLLAVGDRQTQARRATCAQCPHRRNIDANQSSYQAEAGRRVARMTGETVSLGWCALHQGDVRLVTRVEAPSVLSLSPSAECWHKS